MEARTRTTVKSLVEDLKKLEEDLGEYCVALGKMGHPINFASTTNEHRDSVIHAERDTRAPTRSLIDAYSVLYAKRKALLETVIEVVK